MPDIEITATSDPAIALALHDEAHRMCFVARSVTFPVEHRPEVVIAAEAHSENGTAPEGT